MPPPAPESTRVDPLPDKGSMRSMTLDEGLSVPEEVRTTARLTPGEPIASVDPCWPGDGQPPEWAVLGYWHSGPDGTVVGFERSPAYRPSPLALDWPDPTDPVDASMQLAATGYAEYDEIAAQLASFDEVAVLVHADGAVVRACAPDGPPAVPVFTSQAHLRPVDRLAHAVWPVTELLSRVPSGHELFLNPTGPVAILVSVEAVAAVLTTGGPDGPHTGTEPPS